MMIDHLIHTLECLFNLKFFICVLQTKLLAPIDFPLPMQLATLYLPPYVCEFDSIYNYSLQDIASIQETTL